MVSWLLKVIPRQMPVLGLGSPYLSCALHFMSFEQNIYHLSLKGRLESSLLCALAQICMEQVALPLCGTEESNTLC